MLQPAVIDGPAFARTAGTLGGRLGLDALPRLAQTGCSAALVDFVLKGEINERGRAGLHLCLTGSLRLQCQRCLGDVESPLRLDARLELAASEEEVLAAEDDVDRVVASRETDVAALVEDEVLLALPMVAKHEQCRSAAELDGGAAPAAFQALAALKKLNRQGV